MPEGRRSTTTALAAAAVVLSGVAAAGRPDDAATGRVWWAGWDAGGIDDAVVPDPAAAPGPGVLTVALQVMAAVALAVVIILLLRRVVRRLRLRGRGLSSWAATPGTGRARRFGGGEAIATADAGLADAALAGASDLAETDTAWPWARSDAVIAAWVRLETAAASAGTHRRGHDTAAEFATHLAARRPRTADPLRTLLELYGRARFSDEELGPADGRTAHTALHRLHGVLLERAGGSETESSPGVAGG